MHSGHVHVCWMGRYDITSSIWQHSVVFWLTHTKPHSFIAPQPFKRGLITNRKVMIYSSGSPCSAHTQVFWATKHMLERLVILGTWPGHLQKIFLDADNINKTCCRVHIMADYWSWLGLEKDCNSEKSNQFRAIQVQKTIPFHKILDHLQLLYHCEGGVSWCCCLVISWQDTKMDNRTKIKENVFQYGDVMFKLCIWDMQLPK